ncbi:uncharacterized protein FFB14_13525 [Fusarium fujikuroi]|nr:uncharacterized protein FFB14_13525 [Fusarium fujikuroi]
MDSLLDSAMAPPAPAKRGRSDSFDDGDEDARYAKMSKVDTSTLKRPSSPGLDLDRSIKKAKDKATDFLFGKDASKAPFMRYDNFNIYNPQFVTLESNGEFVPMVPAHPQSALIDPVTGLVTPQITPEEKLGDPFNSSNRPAGVLEQDLVPGPLSKNPIDIVLTGDIRLFNLIPAKIEIYRTLTEAQPYTEIVRPAKGRLSLGEFLPSLKDGVLDSIVLDNLRFCYVEDFGDPFLPSGAYFETDIVFQGAMQPVSDALRDFFGQDKPALHFSAHLGAYRDWDDPWDVVNLVLSASLDRISFKALGIFEWTRLGVEVLAFADVDCTNDVNPWSLGFGFFGDVNMTVPGSIVPLRATYRLRKMFDTYSLLVRLQDDEWKDVFGIRGFDLQQVLLSATLGNLSSNDKTFSLSVEAQMVWHETTVSISGTYSKDHYSLEAYVGNLALSDLEGLFKQLTGEGELDVFDHDVKFNSIYLQVSTEGIVLSGSITINGHSSAGGCVTISKAGVSITGGVSDVSFEGFEIHNAEFDVFIGSKKSQEDSGGRSTRFAISGDVSFCGIDVRAGVFTQKDKDGPLKWAVYGEASGNLSTASLCPVLKDTFLDVTLSNLALVAMNHDMTVASFNKHNYPLAKGVQFCAKIESIPELESLLKGSVKGTVLQACYTGGKFKLSLILPAARTITFGDRVYTGPLSLGIHLGASPTDILLVLNAELNVVLDTQPHPLAFALGLKAGYSGASAYAQMITDWINPCGIGKEVVIRGGALEFGIIYSTFLATGMPGEMGFAGQINIGSKEAKMAMKLSQNPKEQLLAAAVKDLGVADLVKFASLIAEKELPEPDDFLHFNDVELYISTGTKIGLTEYPPGASLKGDMTIFGKRAKFECTVGSMIKLLATIEAFNIGPLQVTGATGPDPIVDIVLSSDKQTVLIDGAVTIMGASAALHLEASFLPSTTFDFWVDLRLSDLFMLKLQAKLTGKFNVKDLKSLEKADFAVKGVMEQHIIEYISQQVQQQIDVAQKAAKEGFDSVKAELDRQEAAFKAKCDAAIAELERARAIWNEKRDRVNGEFERVKQSTHQTVQGLKDSVDRAEASWKQLIAEVERALEEARNDANAAIGSAQSDLNHAQEDSDRSIREAQDDLQRARNDFDREFGNAVRDIENARHDVERAQGSVNDVRWSIDRVNREIDDTSWYNCGGLYAERASLEIALVAVDGSLEVVKGILHAAEWVVQSTGYVTAEATIGTAVFALDRVRDVKGVALDAAKLALDGVRETHNLAIEAASEAVSVAKTASEELHVFEAAKGALDAGESVAQGAINTAQDAVNALASCTEFLAFDVAEKGLQFARDNTSELNLARHAVEIGEKAVDIGLDMAKWAVDHAGKMFDIQLVEFEGSIQGLVGNGPPLRVKIAGVVFGDYFVFELVWSPGFDLIKFIKELFAKLWELIKDAAASIMK